jgi:predicted dehydrogenase
MQEIRVAVIGYGLAGSVFHAPFVSATPGMRLAAIVTGNAERQAKARAAYPGVRIVESPERLWEEAGDYDLAVVGAPNGTHVSLALAALGAGLHVVVDKPFAPTSAEGRGVIDEARRRGKLVIPFHNRRWDGDLRTVRRLLDEGALGDVWRFESKFERWRGEPKPRWCVPEARALGEGMLHDIATHLVDQALVLFGPVRSVYAELDARLPGVTTEDDALLCLTHASGVRSRLWPSAVSGQSGPRFAVYGSEGTYLKYGLDPQEDAMKAGEGPPTRPGWGEEPEERWGTLGVGGERRVVRTEPGDYKHFYAGVARAVRDGAPPPVAPEDAVAGLEIIEAAYRSAAERCAVSL